MLKATYRKYSLHFVIPGETSRGVMYDRTSWFLFVSDTENPSITGVGECPPLSGLSRDNLADIESVLGWVCSQINNKDLLHHSRLWEFPSILFGTETALADLEKGGSRCLFDNPFYHQQAGIPINGLVWMASIENMRKQISHKIEGGHRCIKIKIGSKNIEQELNLIRDIRNHYGWEVEIRVDANGAFAYDSVIPVLHELADLKVHSIEQPLPPGQFGAMARLCKITPVPVALDEDIVRWALRNEKERLLTTLMPQYIVLKPGLTGGFNETSQWIGLAENLGIGWWITSALESNIGLNAIAQFTGQWLPKIYQGLGTGQVFDNNFSSPLFVSGGALFYNHLKDWDLKPIHTL